VRADEKSLFRLSTAFTLKHLEEQKQLIAFTRLVQNLNLG
jgi:hypothetical protein